MTSTVDRVAGARSPTAPIAVREYLLESRARSAQWFASDAIQMAKHGFQPIAEAWEGDALTVIYRAQGPSPAPVAVPVPALVQEVARRPAAAWLDPAERRRALLAFSVQRALAHGGRVESRDDRSALIVYGHRVHHFLHLLLTVVTVGAWLLVWMPMAILGGERRERITVDEAGGVSTQRL